MGVAVVIDDMWVVRDLIVSVLEMKGLEVQAFGDYGAALRKGHFSRASLVVVRLQASGIGEEILRVLRDAGHTMPILCTGVGLEPAGIERAGTLGAQAYIDIPFGPWAFAEKVNVLLRGPVRRYGDANR